MTDAAIDRVTLDLGHPFGIVEFGRDTSLPYRPRDQPDLHQLDVFFAECCDKAIDIYPFFDGDARERLHAVVVEWRAALQAQEK